ncbi:hypothetical protein GCM10009119_38410 [Algoriphagus jejuensis]|uniref:N-acetyltransferase domain-containing protein n=1 Tax=Algoriphagus jejuensis TaxID=419934 RepID=A0ABP3YH99_9BACT
MDIRTATHNDNTPIIELLRVSLGESLIPKSEKLWQWKHVDNPFGKSPVLLAEDNGQVVGIRAFLQWEFSNKGKTIKACRAVDTATHPTYQGRGIFNQLTGRLLEEVTADGIDLIYNTPNSKSAPGYLKMGWESWGKLPLKLNFHLANSRKTVLVNSDWAQVQKLVQTIETGDPTFSEGQTRLVKGYLNWRYRDNPLYHYQFISDGEHYLLVYRIKEGKMGREFRICDLFTKTELSKNAIKELGIALNQQIKISGARFSSFSGLAYSKQNVLDMGLLPILRVGPLVTLRKVSEHFSPMDQVWNWSLGDLEVF